MPDIEETVYYEDVEPSAAPKASQDASDARTEPSNSQASSTAPEPTAAAAAAATRFEAQASSGQKRQRTLHDMFSGGASKKPKTVATSSSKAAASSAATTSTAVARPKAGAITLNSIPFSLSGYLQSLSDEQRELLRLECDTINLSWLKVLQDEIKKPYFLNLKRFLRDEGVTTDDIASKKSKIFPPAKNIYNWSHTPLGRVKCVIIGQDPYHGPGQAHGFCFSVQNGVPVPPSLRNIYTELKNEYPDFEIPKHGNLTPWAEQEGVLMLNSALTVRSGEANSHSGKGWETFTAAVVDAVDKYGGSNIDKTTGGLPRGVVFLLWGAFAAKRVSHLSKTKHLILTSAHPSPLSAHRGFLGNNHFRKANEWLQTKYGPSGVIDWCKL